MDDTLPATPPTTILLVLAGGADPLGATSALQDAGTPTLDRVAREGLIGRVALDAASSWDGFVGLLGLPPGAMPLGVAEALAAGVDPAGGPAFVARADFVTVDDERLLDPRGGGVDDPEAGVLAQAVASALAAASAPDGGRLIRAGGGRNVWVSPTPLEGGPAPWCSGRRAPRAVLSVDPASLALFDAARDVLERHDVNVVRVDLGENPANALWPHGAGALPIDVEAPAWTRGRSVALVGGGGALVGLATALGWDAVRVDGDDDALCAAALDAVATHDVVVVRTTSIVSAGVADDADEARAARRDAHSAVDARLAGPLLGALEERGAFVFGLAADGGFDVESRTFSAEPVPFGILRSGDVGGHGVPSLHEIACRDAGHDLDDGRAFTAVLSGHDAH